VLSIRQNLAGSTLRSGNTLRIGGMWATTGGVALTGKGALNLRMSNDHQIVEVVEWGWQSTGFSAQVARLARANADIYRSHTAYEIIYLVKDLIERSSIENTEETPATDRRKLRDAIAGVRSFEGMIGPISINPENHPTKPREAEKELFLLQVRSGQWTTLLSPPGFPSR